MKQKKRKLQEKVIMLMKDNLLEVILDLNKNHHQLTPSTLSSLLNCFPSVAFAASEELVKCPNVMIHISVKERPNSSPSISIQGQPLGELNWSEYLEGEEGEENGLILHFIFNDDSANSKFYLIKEGKLMKAFAEYCKIIQKEMIG